MRSWIGVVAGLGCAGACTTFGSASESDAGDGGPGAGAGAIHCPGVTCSAPSICCVTDPDPSNAFTHAYSCTDPTACSGVILGCSTSASCTSGEVCCALLNGSFVIQTALCLPSSQCRGEVLCEPGAGDCRDAGAPVCLKEFDRFPQLNICRTP
jgi:hypothetical protein